MKGQTQALTAVLITTVTVGAVASAYVWGTPWLEKQQSQSELQNFEQKVVSIKDTGVRVARSGRGSVERIDLELGSGRIEILESENAIRVSKDSPDNRYGSAWTLIQGTNLQNVSIGAGSYALKGKDSPAVVLARGSGAEVVYRIEFRSLKTGEEIERTNIEALGQTSGRGDLTVILQNTGTATSSTTIRGNNFRMETTDVRVDIQ